MDNVTQFYEICAGRFLAWVADDGWPECMSRMYEDYLHDANAMLRVMYSKRILDENWRWDILVDGESTCAFLEDERGYSVGNVGEVLEWSGASLLTSILYALLGSPLYKEWKATL